MIQPNFENGLGGQLTPSTIIDHVNEITKPVATENQKFTNSLFKIKTANTWINEAKSRPIPKMLFSEFWHESEVCILFADTNVGKSILAVQIANSISKSEPINAFKLEAQKQKVLYFDFELSDKQFENRYSDNYTNHYQFDDNFIRVEIDPEAIAEIPENMTFDDFLTQSLENSIIASKAKILIIDNITYLKSETEKAKNALPLMKHLKKLKTKYNLSIMVLAHTPKRDMSRPIGQNDLQGSKMLINFCDSSFAIGKSHSDKDLRYLKQIKARNTEIKHDTTNVIVCQIEKPNNFLRFELINFGNEKEHLKYLTENDKSNKVEQVKELIKEGKTQRTIAKELGISIGSVNKYSKM